jgi:hypothetical protein
VLGGGQAGRIGGVLDNYSAIIKPINVIPEYLAKMLLRAYYVEFLVLRLLSLPII